MVLKLYYAVYGKDCGKAVKPEKVKDIYNWDEKTRDGTALTVFSQREWKDSELKAYTDRMNQLFDFVKTYCPNPGELFHDGKLWKFIGIQLMLANTERLSQRTNAIAHIKDILKDLASSLRRNLSNSYNCRENAYSLYKKLMQYAGDTESDDRLFTEQQKRCKWDESSEHVCSICNLPILCFEDAAGDHIVPYSAGGHTTLENMQLVHKRCNSSKGNRQTCERSDSE